MWQARLEDLQQELPESAIAAKPHKGLFTSLVASVDQFSGARNRAGAIDRTGLSKSDYTNELIRNLVVKGLTVIVDSLLLPDWGGLS